MIVSDFKQWKKILSQFQALPNQFGKRALTKETVPGGATNQPRITGRENDAASGEFVDGARTDEERSECASGGRTRRA